MVRETIKPFFVLAIRVSKSCDKEYAKKWTLMHSTVGREMKKVRVTPIMIFRRLMRILS